MYVVKINRSATHSGAPLRWLATVEAPRITRGNLFDLTKCVEPSAGAVIVPEVEVKKEESGTPKLEYDVINDPKPMRSVLS